MTLKVFTDGGSRGNPGPAAIGMVFYRGGEKVFQYREDIGIATNNVAEYTAALRALEILKRQTTSKKIQVTRIKFYSDSRLMVNQVNGVFKVKNARIREFIFKIRTLEAEIKVPITYHHIPREENKEADRLVNLAQAPQSQ